MTMAQIRSVLIGAGAASLLTFMFIQQRSVDPRQHNRFIGNLLRMKQLDAEINRDLLSSRYELLRSYDPFVQKLDEIRKAGADLQLIPLFVSGSKREQIVQLLKRESEVLSEKARLVETFKSNNAVLNNSLRYFPVLMAEATRAAAEAKDTQFQVHLTNLFRDILLSDLTSHSDLVGVLNAEITLIASDATRRPALGAILGNVRAHAMTITLVKPQVEATSEELNSFPTGRSFDAIFRGLFARL